MINPLTLELRNKLDALNIEYDGNLLYETEWIVNGITWHAKECGNKLNVYIRNNDLLCTPEEAVAASLGKSKTLNAERDANFAEDMRYFASSKDTEIAHYNADCLLCDILLSHGYSETVKVFEEMNKWYA